jgi:ATP-dependent Clp protease protease subunit
MWPFTKRKTADPHDPEKALQHRIVRLDGVINDATAQVAIAQLLYLQHRNERKPVTLRIESPGGSVAAGMAVVDTVRRLRPLVRTRAPAMAQGIALVVLASGNKGARAVGSEAELSFTAIESRVDSPIDERRLRFKVAGIIAELSGQHAEAVAQHLLVGHFLTPTEAVAYGLADLIEP